MRPRRTHRSNGVASLEGATEDSDLWIEHREGDHELSDEALLRDVDCFVTVWQPTDSERRRIADGENIEVTTYYAQPPMFVTATDIPLGKRPA